jgi:hypothetical protein
MRAEPCTQEKFRELRDAAERLWRMMSDMRANQVSYHDLSGSVGATHYYVSEAYDRLADAYYAYSEAVQYGEIEEEPCQ